MQVGVLYKMKNERIRGLNRNLNDGWYFRKLEVISQLGSKVGPFSQVGLQLDLQLRNWTLKLRNGTRVPRRCFVTVKIFAS